MAKQKEKKESYRNGGLFIPAGLFIGLGIGLLNGNPGVGVLLGLGFGFLAMAVSRYFRK